MKLCAWLLLIVCVCCHFVVYGRADAFVVVVVFNDCCNKSPQTTCAYLLSYSSEVRSLKWLYRAKGNISAGSRDSLTLSSFSTASACTGVSPALLHALEYPLHYCMHWTTPALLHALEYPLHNSHISFSRYTPPTSPASV